MSNDPTLTTAPPRAHRTPLGIVLKLISIGMLAGMAVAIKKLGTAVPIGETIFVRAVVAVLALALLAYFTVGLKVLKTNHLERHARRSLAGSASMFCFYAALTMMPLADVTAIGFTSPMFVTLLAMFFLGERIHAFRWTALGLGFLGAVIMTAPHLNWQHGQPMGVLMAFGATSLSAVAMIFLRRMSGEEHAITITFYFMLTAGVCGLLTVPFGWVVPTATQWWLILLAAVFGVAGQLLMTFSYRYAEASTIAPLDYSNIVLAVSLGYLLFNEVPVWQVWVGAPLVIASGLIIFWREYQLHLARTALPIS